MGVSRGVPHATYVSPMITDGIAMLVGAIKYHNWAARRLLQIQGKIITREPLEFLSEESIGMALTTFRNYIDKTEISAEEPFRPTVFAGTKTLVFM